MLATEALSTDTQLSVDHCTGGEMQHKVELQHRALEETLAQFDKARDQLLRARQNLANSAEQARLWPVIGTTSE